MSAASLCCCRPSSAAARLPLSLSLVCCSSATACPPLFVAVAARLRTIFVFCLPYSAAQLIGWWRTYIGRISLHTDRRRIYLCRNSLHTDGHRRTRRTPTNDSLIISSIELNNLFYVFTSYSTSNAPKTIELRFPRASRLSHLPSILPSVTAASFWLAVAFKTIDRWPFKAAVYFILYIFC
jgi:hypothetical protein